MPYTFGQSGEGDRLEALVKMTRKDLQRQTNEQYEKRITELEQELKLYKGFFRFSRVPMLHELRTPLSAILGMPRLLLQTSLTPTQQEFTEAILHSSQVLLHTINNFASIIKLIEGRVRLDNNPFPLSDLLEDVANRMQRIDNRQTVVTFSIADGLSKHQMIDGDQGRLSDLLCNLTLFAVYYSLEQTMEIALSQKQTADKSLLDFQLNSHRRLFSAETMAEMAQFFRSTGEFVFPTDRLLQDDNLVASKLLCDLLGGEIRVESRPENGMTFHLVIPYEPG